MSLLHSTKVAATVVVGVASLTGCGSKGSGSATGSSTSGTPASASSSTSSATSTSAGPSMSDAPASQPASSPSSTPASTGVSHTAAGLARCTTAHLKIAVAANNADMQGSHSSLQFTNTGTQPCELTGAPGVSYVAGDDGHQVGLPASRVIGHSPTVLQPGATASAGLFLSSAPEKTPCQQVHVRGLRVYPPDSYTALYAPHPGIACAPPMNGPYLKVGPILPGAHNTI